MLNTFSRKTSYMMMLAAAAIMSLATGCASGGFKLTRQYAGFVNKQNIIVRIILYILTAVVFAVTMLVDMVIFNTMDFWNGRVAQGTYNYNKDGKSYAATHRYLPGGLRESQIEVKDESTGKVLQQVVIRETIAQTIEVMVDGKLKGNVSNIHDVPQLTMFDKKGVEIANRPLFTADAVAVK